MDAVTRVDRTLVELNLLPLLFVALVPWPTGLLAEHLREGEGSPVAAVTYGVVMMLMAGSFTAIWLHLARAGDLTHPELRPGIGVAIRRSAERWSLWPAPASPSRRLRWSPSSSPSRGARRGLR